MDFRNTLYLLTVPHKRKVTVSARKTQTILPTLRLSHKKIYIIKKLYCHKMLLFTDFFVICPLFSQYIIIRKRSFYVKKCLLIVKFVFFYRKSFINILYTAWRKSALRSRLLVTEVVDCVVVLECSKDLRRNGLFKA